ncbi:unnamed protein product [Victoria cruziana]
MGLPCDDVVLVRHAQKVGEPTVITVNCPNKTGLGCDLCWIILEFGLSINRGDVFTDGRWCYIVFWVVPQPGSFRPIRWSNLKTRLLSICPSCSVPIYYVPEAKPQKSSVHLLKFICSDRKGLLHDVTHVLTELELMIHKVKVSTAPDGGVVDLFFITDCRELLHTKQRKEDTCERLTEVLGGSCQSCEIQPAGPEYESYQHGFSSLPSAVADELFCSDLSEAEVCPQTLVPDVLRIKKATLSIDNSLSPAHTLLQIQCLDQKCLLYDIMRTLKDCGIKIAHGRFSSNPKGYCELDLFIVQADGKKIVDPEKQESIFSRLKMEMLYPLRLTIANRGPDTELLVANPVELCGKGRPRVFYDVTLALKALGICIFSVRMRAD